MNSSELDASSVTTLLDAVGAHLDMGRVRASIVVVGGAALALRGWVPRTTHDVDVIALATENGDLARPHLPEVLVAAVRRVARDFGLPDDWLNTAVAAQWDTGLPDALDEDLDWRVFRGLRVGLVGRRAAIALKLFAAVDLGPSSVHTQDLLALLPTDPELASARAWVVTQDAAPEWPQLVDEVVDHVRSRRDR